MDPASAPIMQSFQAGPVFFGGISGYGNQVDESMLKDYIRKQM